MEEDTDNVFLAWPDIIFEESQHEGSRFLTFCSVSDSTVHECELWRSGSATDRKVPGEKMPLCQASVVHSVFIVHDRRLDVCPRRMWPWR